MEINWSIVGWLAAVIVLYLIGIFEGRGQGYKKRKAEEEQAQKDQPPPQPEIVTVDNPGILRVKNENGSFALDLDGNRVNPMSLLPDQRKRLIEVLNIMRGWLEGKPLSGPNVTAQQASFQSQQTASMPSARSDSLPPIFPPSSSQQPTAAKPATIPKEDRPAGPANSIVTQIDTILQERLAGTPLEERGIFLAQSLDGSVIVYVGLTRYHGVDEVPDLEVKAAIREAIKEWEKKYTPGL
jgi:hypothetical protein